MSQTPRDYSKKRDDIPMPVFADKKGGLMAAFFSLSVEIRNRLRPDRP